MTKKKLLFLNSSLGSGGAERQMVRLIEFLNERSVVPDVLTYCDTKDDYKTTAKMVRHNVGYKNKLLRNIFLVLKLLCIRPSVILSYCGDPNYLACLYKKIRPSCRVIVSERNIVSFPVSGKLKKLYEYYSRVDKIVSNSHTQAMILSERYPQYAGKIKVITNYTDPKQELRTSKSTEPIKITVLARYHEQKNTLAFLKAVSILNNDESCPKFICEWYGRNTINTNISSYYQECVKLKDDLELSNVFLNGYSDDTDKIIEISDVICLPSLKEGFSNTLSEAICMGKPVLASNVSDNSLFVHPERNGYLFNPSDIDDMASKIKTMLLKYKEYPSFGHYSYELSQMLFNKEKFVNDYLDVLQVENN